jgi:hypothetical protein
MLKNETIRYKFGDILVALKSQQYLRAEEITKSCISYCEHQTDVRDARIVKHNVMVVRRIVRDVKSLLDDGMGHDGLDKYLSDMKNFKELM